MVWRESPALNGVCSTTVCINVRDRLTGVLDAGRVMMDRFVRSKIDQVGMPSIARAVRFHDGHPQPLSTADSPAWDEERE